jgi:hypothetical protein
MFKGFYLQEQTPKKFHIMRKDEQVRIHEGRCFCKFHVHVDHNRWCKCVELLILILILISNVDLVFARNSFTRIDFLHGPILRGHLERHLETAWWSGH